MQSSRYSKQREAIRNILKNSKSHMDAQRLFDEAKKELPDISMGTVYRNLKELHERGEIVILNVGSGTFRYDGNTSFHAHFYCRECKGLFDFDADTAVFERLKQQGYMPDGMELTVSGLCTHCLKKAQRNKHI
jgi:Fur family peroxide stress response transcriptional regulator